VQGIKKSEHQKLVKAWLLKYPFQNKNFSYYFKKIPSLQMGFFIPKYC